MTLKPRSGLVWTRRWLISAGMLLVGFAAAQMSDHESKYGPPVDVALSDLLLHAEQYHKRAVRTRGPVGLGVSAGNYILGKGAMSVNLVPVPELASDFQAEVVRSAGREVQVTGVFFRARADDPTRRANGYDDRSVGQIVFWSYVGPPEELTKSARDQAALLTLEALVSQPARREGQLVRVAGQFRGHNLFGDLPVLSRMDGDDWVLKDDLHAVWITGKQPKGDGFQLDASERRDAGKWIEVIGRVRVAGNVVYLQALELRLAAPRLATPATLLTPAAPLPPPRPPVIVFSLPLDGERDIEPDGTFTVQFSKDMDSRSFAGRVQVRYAGPLQPGDHGFHAARWAYEEGRRALTVVPGDRLASGRTIELVFLEGIVDAEGLPLLARSGRVFEGAVEVLSWQARATF